MAMAQSHRHNWRFVRANPSMPGMDGAVAQGATLWACTGCPMTQIRPGPGGMRIVGTGSEGLPAASDPPPSPQPLPAPPAGWLGSNVSLAVGYTRPDGTNDVAIVTPKSGLNRRQLSLEAQSSWAQIQAEGTPVWVDGQPTTLVQDVAAATGLAIGWPDGWFMSDPVVAGG